MQQSAASVAAPNFCGEYFTPIPYSSNAEVEKPVTSHDCASKAQGELLMMTSRGGFRARAMKDYRWIPLTRGTNLTLVMTSSSNLLVSPMRWMTRSSWSPSGPTGITKMPLGANC